MNRRDFFKSILAAGVVAIADPEKLLWMPGEKVYFIPSPKLQVHDPATIEALKKMMRAAVDQMRRDIDEALFRSQPIIITTCGQIDCWKELEIRQPAIWTKHK